MPSRRRRPDPNVAAVRRAALVHSGRSIQDLATAGGCSWRFAKYWVEDEKTSKKLEAVHAKITKVRAA
jgi:hypothetical protein